MTPNPKNTPPLQDLQTSLTGSLLARRTPGRSKIPFSHPSGEIVGEIAIQDSGADIVLGDLSVVLERDAHFRYRMLAAGKELLSAAPSDRGLERLSIHYGDRTYEARISPLRNTAVAHADDGTETARVSGGLLGLKYQIDFDTEDPRGLPIAVLILYHLLTVRSRAYRATPVRLPPGGL